MNKTTKFIGRIVAGAYYDMQQVRISTKNRIRDVIRKNIEGIDFDKVEKKKEEKSFEKKYKDEELFRLWDKLLADKKIDKEEYNYVLKCWKISNESEKIERKYKTAMREYILNEKVYRMFLKGIRGIGEVLSANLIKEFGDCSQYDTISKLWANTGNAVINGIAPKKTKGEKLNFSPRLKVLCWKLSDCLLKSNKGIYRQIYNTTKERYTNKDYKKGELFEKYGKPYKKEDTKLSKGHCHNRALRKMRKIFLANYWEASRELNGLETKSPFAEKLGHKNIISWKKALEAEKK